MGQYRVYQNRRGTHGPVPYLLDVQSDLVETGSRVVVPLVLESEYGVRFSRLNPVFRIDGLMLVAATSDLAAVSAGDLGTEVADVSAYRDEIVAALDFLILGY